ncbi:hypothetical protein [Muricauda sp. MAR_2010_75]|uniref:hypothetical protein n=1 Tax=Allomuricauda sp. MAR_2010_75 TaxID=1250232 RepID=UPI000690CF81|nr:hypothetical protein [Muricauda sp. MAR_2010_75]
MAIETNISGFEQAKTLLSDIIFKLKSDKKSESDLQKLKLLQARHNNPEFEMEIAELICGDNNSFPYRSSFFLTKFFKDLGFPFEHDGTTRRFWVRDTLLLLDIHDLSLVFRKGLFNKRDFKKYTKENKLDFDSEYQKAIKEFKEILNDSLQIDDGMDLSYLLDLNVNVELLFDRKTKTNDQELDSLINEAKDRFFIPKDKQIALEKLWDAFERIKTYFGSNKKKSSSELVSIASDGFNFEIIESEFKLLTKIGNEYKIRHHETDKLEVSKSKHIDYLFFRMLSLIDLCIKSINEK